MAIFNEILEGRFNRALQKLFSMKQGPVTPQLSGELMPVLPFFWGAEARYLEGWNLFGQFVFVAAGGAGTFGHVRLRNPIGSGIMAVITSVKISESTQNDFPQVQYGNPSATQNDEASIAPGRFSLDSRGASSATSILSFGTPTVQVPTNASALAQVGVLNNTTIEIVQTDDQEIPLPPGNYILVTGNTANTGLAVTFMWRERVLADSEKF